MSNDEPTRLAKFIKAKRLKRKLRVVDLAKEMGVRSPTVCQWETGKARPSVDRMVLLAEVLGVDLTELVKRAEPIKRAA